MAVIEVFDHPTTSLVSSFNASVNRVVRWVDIYQSDNTTLWYREAPVTEGSVSVDMGRSERRNIDITLVDIDGQLPHGPDGLWYDKILKPFMGIELDGIQYVTCLGEFMIDKLERPQFPNVIKVTGRDFVKKLLLDKFTATTTFSAATTYEAVIKTIATNGGITKFNLSPSGKTLTNAFTIERNTERWKAIEDLADAAGCQIYFDNFGYLTLSPFVDPYSAPVAHTFKTGTDGNLVTYTKTAEDTRMRNHVVVYGDGTNNPLVFGEASNTEPSSPTRIAKIGRRTYPYATKVLATNSEAQALALALLKVMALEQYDVGMDALVAPWLEAGEAIEFIDPEATAGTPTRFLLSNFTIPLGLQAMSVSAKRIHLVK